jgi:hypothetical protein
MSCRVTCGMDGCVCSVSAYLPYDGRDGTSFYRPGLGQPRRIRALPSFAPLKRTTRDMGRRADVLAAACVSSSRVSVCVSTY